MNRRHFLLTVSALAFATSAAGAQAATRRRVGFESRGEYIVGDLFLPARTPPSPGSAIVVTGAWFTVKEQMPTRYAEELARRGYAALVFDFRGFGESGGAIRQRETPSAKIDDILAAVEFLKSRPEVDATRIGALGICASAGYMAAAAAGTRDIRSLALVAPWLHDAEIVAATYGGTKGVSTLRAAAARAAAAYRSTGSQVFVPGASLTDRDAVMFGVPYYTEAGRGMIPAWRNEIDPAFWEDWLSFDAIRYAPEITQPFTMVHSEAAAIPQGAHRFFERIGAPKTELWIDDVSQFDFYDRDRPVMVAADAVAGHFQRTV